MTTAVPGETCTVAEDAEKELLTVLALKESTYAEIDALITKYRAACEAALLEDFTAAAARNVELRLWNAHGKINNRYRSRLGKFRDEDGKKRPVERRKLKKRYLEFIKSSMRFYRGYIQRLASHFRSPKEILEVAHKLHLDTLSVDPAIAPSQQETQLIIDSCHASLVRLGDLSRYRETELQTDKRNWAPAVGYYNLAAAIKPSSGASHNQMAVIALADGSHLRALYHLYRALSVQIPYPRARENLETEFKKIIDRKNKNQLFPEPSEQQPGGVLQAWFVYLHAKLHAGVSFPEHEELENEVLTNLSVELKERPLEGLLHKFTLSNIAAQHLASVQAAELSETASEDQTFIFFLRFNVKTLFTLLQILLRELEQIVADDYEAGNVPSLKDVSERISATARRILPCLRHYSGWLVSNVYYLVALENHDFVGLQITEFWRIYADALTLLAATFPKSDLPHLDYLLEEDEDTIAFTPFTNSSTLRRYLQADRQTSKPRSRDLGVERHHPSVEMLFRVRGLLEDGIAIATTQDEACNASVPLTVIDDSNFEFKEKNLPPEPSRDRFHAHTRSSASINRADIELARPISKPFPSSTNNPEDAPESIAPSTSTSTAMNRMVDGLVASEISEDSDRGPPFPQLPHGQSPLTPIGNNFADGTPTTLTPTAHPPFQHSTETIHPILPSISNSPFAPRPGETDPPQSQSQSRPSTLQFSNTRFQASLLRQQRALDLQQQQQQSSLYDLPTTSLSPPPSSALIPDARFPVEGGGGHGERSAVPSPFSGSPSATTFPSYEVPRRGQGGGRWGAVGEVPPSEWAGGVGRMMMTWRGDWC